MSALPVTEPHETPAASMAGEAAGRSFFWCKCGRSFARPFCDGTHAGGCCRRDDPDDDGRLAR